jgi:hypothetical protein
MVNILLALGIGILRNGVLQSMIIYANVHRLCRESKLCFLQLQASGMLNCTFTI